MAKLMRSAALVLAVASPWFILEGSARAQSAAPGATAAFPQEPAPAPAPAPVTTSAPAPLPTPVTTAPPPPPTSSTTTGPAYPEPQPYTASPDAYPGEPPPPPRNPDDGFQRPDISIRIDPFNFLLEGRLGLELETQVYKFLTVEVVPVFVTTQSPPTLNYETYEKSSIHQKSNGIGALSGAAIDGGIWFGGKPFNGYVLRAGFTNYAYTYESHFGNAGGHDSVSHTDRQFFAMLGSHNRWGAFTIAGGIGLAYELNKQNRCLDDFGAQIACDEDKLQIRITDDGTPANLHPFLYPFDLLARFSLGVVF